MNGRAAAARALLVKRNQGILCTNSVKQPGFPFGSVTPYAIGPGGDPVFLMSGLALHTRNLAADAKASLLVLEDPASPDPLASGRVNVFGAVEPVGEADLAGVRTAYLEQHPSAGQWVEFGDFRFYRMSLAAVYFVGGFGEMGWVSAADMAADC